MKKCYLLLGLLFAISLSTYADITDPTIRDKGNGQNGGGPRGIDASVELTSSGNNLVFDISYFSGDVELEILTAGTSYYTTINGNGTFVINVTGISNGCHEFTLTLSNGLSYNGSFVMR